MTVAGVLPSVAAWRELKREIRALKLVQKNQLRTQRPRASRHQGGRFPAVYFYLGKTDSSISKGSSGTVSIWDGVAGSETDTGRNLDGVYNRFGNVGSGKWVMVIRRRGELYLIAAECP